MRHHLITLIGLITYIALLMFAISGAPCTKTKPVEQRREYKHWGEG